MPVCFVVDEEPSIRSFLSLVLHGVGIDTEEFADGASFRQALERRAPDLVFLDVGLESAEAIEAVVDLGKRGYFGFVQLMSNRGSAVLEHVKSVGEQHKLQMLPVLKKPFDDLRDRRDHADAQARPRRAAGGARRTRARRSSNGWIEFWYQPKIDLRRKQLAGVEAFARCRHPQLGILLPGRLHAGRERSRADDAVGACAGKRAEGRRAVLASSGSICGSPSTSRSARW